MQESIIERSLLSASLLCHHPHSPGTAARARAPSQLGRWSRSRASCWIILFFWICFTQDILPVVFKIETSWAAVGSKPSLVVSLVRLGFFPSIIVRISSPPPPPCLILHDTVLYCLILSYTAWYCPILPDTAWYCLILPDMILALICLINDTRSKILAL